MDVGSTVVVLFYDTSQRLVTVDEETTFQMVKNQD